MRRTGLILGLVALGLSSAAQAASSSDPALHPDLANPGAIAHPEWFKSSFLDLNEDIGDAAAEGRHLMLYFYQDGCPYCKLFIEKNLQDPDIQAEVRAHFEIVPINMYGSLEVTDTDGSVSPESEFARKQGIQFTPTIAVYSPEGEQVFRMNGYYPPARFRAALRYLNERRYRTEKFGAYLKSLPKARPDGRPVRKGVARGAGDLTKRHPDQPMLVLFEEDGCSICDELHQDILLRTETRELLEHTELVVLDMYGEEPLVTPSGERLTARSWSEKANVKVAPTFVWFDQQGREVFRNEGYIKAFHLQSMLEYVSSGSYARNPEFQRWMQKRSDRLEAQGVEVDLLN